VGESEGGSVGEAVGSGVGEGEGSEVAQSCALSFTLELKLAGPVDPVQSFQ